MIIADQLNHFRPPPQLLQDRVVLITGAGQGLGKSIALATAALGATVILHGRNSTKLEKTYDAIIAANGLTPAIAPLDFSNATDQDFEQLAQTIQHEFGRLDGVIHCAAQLKQLQPLASEKLDDWLNLLRVNLAAPFALTRACMPLLKRSENASIIFVSESHGITPKAYWGGFAVSKFALQGLLQVWQDELSSTEKLRMNIVVPGPFQSPQRALTHPGEDKSTLRAVEDLLPAFLYLLAEDSKAIAGQVIELDRPSAVLHDFEA
jgi:NAD(P)-dependent dehydrogenase (short-subunit alcohol dehydrogenase family)